MEEWKDVPGYPGYKISSSGKCSGPRKVLTGKMDKCGYWTYGLYKEGRRQPIWSKAHRLVADAFLPNPEIKPTINHKNGNKVDNRLENLEWSSYREQAIHRCHVLGKAPTSEWNRKDYKLKSRG